MPARLTLPREVVLSATKPRTGSSRRKYLIYFLPGNPGVVAFYKKFLHQLHMELNEANDLTHDVEIFGTSLAGFECDASNDGRSKKLPMDIDDQIRYVEDKLSSHLEQFRGRDEEKREARIILVGHSLGAFLAVEMLQRYRNTLKDRNASRGHRIVSVIGLFPGLVHLAQGEMPSRVAWLQSIPGAASLISNVIRIICLLMPDFLLHMVIAQTTGYPADDVDTTCHWLRSEWGLYEALHLANEEMTRIAADPWDDEVWGASYPTPLSQPRAKLFFLFGEHDDWIPSGPRNDLIHARGRRSDHIGNDWRATMEIDLTGIPHDFAAKHSKSVAHTVANWIRQAIDEDSQHD